MILAYWLKKLTAQHEHREAQMNEIQAAGSNSDWITQDRTPLMGKEAFTHIVTCSAVISNGN